MADPHQRGATPPGVAVRSERDRRNGPNDWVALLTHYGAEVVTKKDRPPARGEFEATLVKVAAVALAALENLDAMVEKRRLLEDA